MENREPSMTETTLTEKTTHRFPAPWKVALLAVVIVALGYWLYAYSPLSPRIQAFWSASFLPAELKSATFFADGPSSTTQYHVQGSSFVADSSSVGTVVSVEKGLNANVMITRDKVDGTYLVLLNGKQIYSTTTPLMGVSAAPDGKNVLFSAQLSKKEQIPAPVYLGAMPVRPFMWTVFLLPYSNGGTAYPIGDGIEPLYVDSNHLLRIASVGIVSVDLRAHESHILFPQLIPSTRSIILRSPDRTLIALPGTAPRSFVVFRVGPDKVEKVASFTFTATATSFALGNDALYAVRNTGKSTEILKQNFSEAKPHVIAALPQSLHITRLLLGTL
jgi:hypothetical protein